MEVHEETERRPWGNSYSVGRTKELWAAFQKDGRNHRKEESPSLVPGDVRVDYVREVDRTYWFVEIGTLEELMALRAQVGHDLIIDDDPPSIVIHDDYIE